VAEFETEIRQAFERRLAGMPARPDLSRRIGTAVRERNSGPRALQVLAASAAVLLVGLVAFYLLQMRHVQPAPIVGPTPGVPSATPSTASPSPSPSQPAGWKTYTNTQFGFSISYPPSFVVENSLNPGMTLPPGWLLEMRVVDRRFLGKIPPGQVEFGVRANDAGTLTAWVQKHTGPCGSPNSSEYYWDKVSNVTPVNAAGREALTFDWNQQACGTPYTLHLTAFVLQTSHVFLFSWYSQDAAYSETLKRIADQMLASFSG